MAHVHRAFDRCFSRGAAAGLSGAFHRRWELAGLAWARGDGICREEKLPLRWSENHNVRWRVPLPDRGNSTPVFAQCLDLQTGQTVWEERLIGSGARNSSWSSPVLAGDRLYVPNQNADVFVLRAGAKFECMATNSIGGEPMNASLAVSDGAIFMRTHRRLWCIAEREVR